MKTCKTPIRTPVANSFAERWIGTLRRELPDRAIIWSRRQLERLVAEFIDRYNTRLPQRSLDLGPPQPGDLEPSNTHPPSLHLVRSPRCGGLINEYRNAHEQGRHSFRHP